MRRGFKTSAERIAERIRNEMGLQPAERLDAIKLARHVGAGARSADELTSLAKLQVLEEIQPGAFSACTFSVGGQHIIVYSPLSSVGRTQSDVAHEVAHIVLGHTTNSVQTIAGMTFYTCDADEEQEANWLGACLLLPRRLLYIVARRGMDSTAIARQYRVTESMAAFRLRTTGVVRQLSSVREEK